MNKSFKKYKLKDVVNFFDGFAFSKNDMQEKGEFHFIKITNLINGKVELDNFKISKPNNYKKENILKGNEILIAMSGSTGKTSFNEYENVLVNQRISILRPKELLVSPRYLRHLLVNKNFETYCNNLGTGQQKNISKNDIGSFEVSIPPMEVQNEIVEVLDKFSALEAALEAELEARTKQYEYYRNKLLDFSTGSVGVPRIDKMLAEMCPDGVLIQPLWKVTAWDKKFNAVENYKQHKIIKYKYLLAKDLKSLEIPFGNVKLLSTGNYDGYTSEDLAGDYLSEGEIVTIPWGGTALVKYFKGKFCTADNRIATSLDVQILNNKFLYYFMVNNTHLIQSFYRGSSIQHPSMRDVLDIDIPVPPIEIQNEIVKILDNFSEYTTSISQGLPAEIAARTKQYEYYRNKLLTFDKE